jgi:D-alanyl-D-alanine carboxypeptidase
MNKSILAALLIFPIFWIQYGCDKNPSAPKTTLPLAEQLQAALDKERASNNLIGVSAAVIIPGQEIWRGVSGMSNPAASEKIRPEMLFNIASITKIYTAALILKLAEEDQLTLEDPLHQWLPGFENIDSTVTIRQLLNHTSGIFDYLAHPDFIPAVVADLTRFWTPEEMLSYAKEPYFSHGSGWEYSNTNYILLGMIIKKVTHSKVSTELRKRFFGPLNLNNTFLPAEEEMVGKVAHFWSDLLDGDGTLDDLSSLPRTAMYSVTWTSGGIFSTADELAKWAHALYGGDILSQASRDQMLAFHPNPPDNGYGLGTERAILLGRELWGHGGGNPVGYTSQVIYSPQDKVTIAVLMNQETDNYPVATALLRVILNFRA